MKAFELVYIELPNAVVLWDLIMKLTPFILGTLSQPIELSELHLGVNKLLN